MKHSKHYIPSSAKVLVAELRYKPRSADYIVCKVICSSTPAKRLAFESTRPQIVTAEIFDKENVTKKKEARKEARKVLQETFEAGKSKWFFTKLRF